VDHGQDKSELGLRLSLESPVRRTAVECCGKRPKLTQRLTHFHIACLISHLLSMINCQTQRTQNPPVLSTLGVRLPLPAPAQTPSNQSLAGASSPHGMREAWAKSLDCAQLVPLSALAAPVLAIFPARLGSPILAT